MAKRMLVDVLERRLREVLTPRDPEAHPIRVDLRGGVIEMTDCKFNAEFSLAAHVEFAVGSTSRGTRRCGSRSP
jgi:hypothetical protein